MKKFTAFLSALLISLSLVFTACGSTKPAAKKAAPKNSTKVTQQVGKNQPPLTFLPSLLLPTSPMWC